MPDRTVILVRGLEFEASHGYTAAERKGTRRFRLDIELEVDLGVGLRSDKLSDTIDYRTVSQIAVTLGTERTHRLVETLATTIADALQERWPHAAVTLTLEKLAPPCPGAPAAAGVRLHRGARTG